MPFGYRTQFANNENETPTGLGAETWMTPEFWQQGYQDLIAALASGSAAPVQGGFRPEDFQPLRANTPSFEEWLASQGPNYRPTGDNTPEYEYLAETRTMPSYGGRGLTNLPLLAMAGVGGLAAGGFGLAGAEGALGAGVTGGTATALGSETAIADLVATGMSPEAAAAAVASGGEAISPFAGLSGGMGGAGGIMAGTAAGRSLIPGIPNNVAAGVGQGILGYLGADKVSDAYRDVSNQNLAIGAPFRDKLTQSYSPDFNLMSQPGYGDALQRTADISARSANVQYGNPYDASAQANIMGNVWNQSYLPALSSYRGQLGQFGGLGLNTAGAAQLGGASQAGGGLDAIGYGLGTIFNPQPNLQDILRQLGGNQQPGLNLNIGGDIFGRR